MRKFINGNSILQTKRDSECMHTHTHTHRHIYSLFPDSYAIAFYCSIFHLGVFVCVCFNTSDKNPYLKFYYNYLIRDSLSRRHINDYIHFFLVSK